MSRSSSSAGSEQYEVSDRRLHDERSDLERVAAPYHFVFSYASFDYTVATADANTNVHCSYFSSTGKLEMRTWRRSGRVIDNLEPVIAWLVDHIISTLRIEHIAIKSLSIAYVSSHLQLHNLLKLADRYSAADIVATSLSNEKITRATIDNSEPSDWESGGRYNRWTIVFSGLQHVGDDEGGTEPAFSTKNKRLGKTPKAAATLPGYVSTTSKRSSRGATTPKAVATRPGFAPTTTKSERRRHIKLDNVTVSYRFMYDEKLLTTSPSCVYDPKTRSITLLHLKMYNRFGIRDPDYNHLFVPVFSKLLDRMLAMFGRVRCIRIGDIHYYADVAPACDLLKGYKHADTPFVFQVVDEVIPGGIRVKSAAECVLEQREEFEYAIWKGERHFLDERRLHTVKDIDGFRSDASLKCELNANNYGYFSSYLKHKYIMAHVERPLKRIGMHDNKVDIEGLKHYKPPPPPPWMTTRRRLLLTRPAPSAASPQQRPPTHAPTRAPTMVAKVAASLFKSCQGRACTDAVSPQSGPQRGGGKDKRAPSKDKTGARLKRVQSVAGRHAGTRVRTHVHAQKRK
jgi:hypothetical protein